MSINPKTVFLSDYYVTIAVDVATNTVNSLIIICVYYQLIDDDFYICRFTNIFDTRHCNLKINSKQIHFKCLLILCL